MSHAQPTCPKCSSPQLKWVTVRRRVPVDVLQCQACGTAAAEEDWMLPLSPLLPGRCLNCGERRDFDNCTNCGLTRAEDAQVHDELRQMVDARAGFLDAAKLALRAGRKLIALKLATWAVATNEGGQADSARAFRVWLLAAIGEDQSALEDCKAWVENTADPSVIAWASYGQQLQHGGFAGAAADAYAKTIAKDPNQWLLRARRAQLLHQLHREGQAIDEVVKIFESPAADEPSLKLALEVADGLVTDLEAKYQDHEIARIIELSGPHAESSAKLLAHRARLAANDGDLDSAKRDLKRARKLDPELEIYQRIEKALKPQKGSWWRW